MFSPELGAQLAEIARSVQAEGDLQQTGDRVATATAEMFGRGTEVGVSIAHRKHQVENGGASAPTVIVGDDLHNELGPGGIRCSGSTSEALPGRGLG